MKRILAITGIVVSALAFGQIASTHFGGMRPDRKTGARRPSRREHAEYDIIWRNSLNAWQSPNRAKNLLVTYFTNGFRLNPRVKVAEFWEVELRLQSIGKGGKPLVPTRTGRAAATVKGGHMVVAHRGFDIEFNNDFHGMRQNFIVHEPPPGNGPLTVRVKARGTLVPMKYAERDILLTAADGGPEDGKVWFRGLTAWDADGKALQAHFEVDRNVVAMVVDDSKASYPVTVDPLCANAVSLPHSALFSTASAAETPA